MRKFIGETKAACSAIHRAHSINSISFNQRALLSRDQTLLSSSSRFLSSSSKSSPTTTYILKAPVISGEGGQVTFDGIIGRMDEIRVGPGQKLASNQIVAVIETDKATIDIRAPVEGFCKEVLCKKGEQIVEKQPVISMLISPEDAVYTF